MLILGISCFYHDAAACILRDGEIVAAAEEERFSRRKHDAGFPLAAARYCLAAAGARIDDINHVIFYEKPRRKFHRILASVASTFPMSRRFFEEAMIAWLGDKLWIGGTVRRRLGYAGRVLFGEHHVSHAASAYYPSPFGEAAVVTADGVGEWTTTTVGAGHGMDLELIEEIRFPHSIGLLYSAFTAYLGFEVNEGEYKVMGMAAYGRPRYVDRVRRLIRFADDGAFRLDLRYFAYHRALRALSPAFIELFGPARRADSGLEERYADIAASIQAVTEEAMLGFARRARVVTGLQSLCLAGGVALNVLANARILRESGFGDIWVQPAAGDSGGSLGAAAYLHHAVLRNERRHRMETAYLGPGYRDDEVRDFLATNDIAFERLGTDELPRRVATLLADGRVVGWFQGRMEFGPRALGARSILADPRDARMKDILNEKIKHREQFRPFAPSVLREAVATHFDLDGTGGDRDSPFMLLVGAVRPGSRELLPAVTHADGTARVHTVTRAHNERYYRVIEEFGRVTGVPVVVNTSFNVRGEPIVRTPAEAFNAFSHTDMDHVVMGDALVHADQKRPLAPYAGRATVHDHAEAVL